MGTTYYQETTVDKETGEELSTHRKKKMASDGDYIKIYLKHINYLNDLPLGLNPIIYELFHYMNWNNQLVINSSIKRQVSEKLGMKFNTVNQNISKLVKLDVLLRVDKGIYIFNPEFYGKGNWNEIIRLREDLEIQVSYNENEYTITHKYQENKQEARNPNGKNSKLIKEAEEKLDKKYQDFLGKEMEKAKSA